ncbi:hypothetical protein [Streptomyces formicae]|uniref:Transcriptional regulator n=1 Tax=Streptomyces formicae TaxID=1616117 RepID=A0ABY3WP91_9ACTN|nr:hypothetical protein [Streptomyces formicae]UNM13132.1 hypothetical protein J4032_17980 [Streptomyces formicae]
MRSKVPNRELAALVAEAGWTSGELAKAVNALGNTQGLALRYDRTSVAHWLTGARPKAPVPQLVAAAFTQRLGRLVSPLATGLTRTPDPMQPAVAGGADAMHQLIELCRNDVDPTRRVLLAGSIYTITEIPLFDPMHPRALLSEPSFTAHGRVTTADVETLAEIMGAFATFGRRFGGRNARTALAGYIAEDAGRLLGRPAPDHIRRDLLTCTGQLTHLLADMTSDTGQEGLAQHYYNLALNLAGQASNHRQSAITLRALSTQAFLLGHYRHARDLVDAAVDTAGSTPDRAVRAYLLTQRALVRAREHPRLASADLSAAEKCYDESISALGPFAGYPRAALEYQRGETLSALGNHTAAHSAWEASLAHRPTTERRPLALTHARIAQSLLRQGHLDAACSHWSTFLDHYPYLHSARAHRALHRLGHHLAPYRRHPHAAALLRRAQELNRPMETT